jgi:predicted ATPase
MLELYEGKLSRTVLRRGNGGNSVPLAGGFALWVGNATFQRGLALTMQGQGEAGITQMHQGLAARGATGTRALLSSYLARLAEAYGGIGQAEKGLALLGEALAHVGTTEERYSEAEIYRIKGELLLRQPILDAAQAEVCFQQALAIARRHEPRASMAAAGPARRGPSAPGQGLRLVH